MFASLREQVIEEISLVLEGVQEEPVKALVESIVNADVIVTCGAGRMGMMARAFAMRLSHLGLKAYHISDCNTPRVGKKDLLLVCSGSGETKTILSLAEIAKQHGAEVALVTSRELSSIASLASVKIVLPAPSKVDEAIARASIQPMTSLTEQSSLMFFDIVVLMLMQRLEQSPAMLKTRHSILE